MALKRPREEADLAAFSSTSSSEKGGDTEPPTPGAPAKRRRVRVQRLLQTLLTRFFSGKPHSAPKPEAPSAEFANNDEMSDE